MGGASPLPPAGKTRTTNKQHAAFKKIVAALGLDRGLTKRLTDLLWADVEPLVLPTVHFGLGHHTRSNTEMVLLGTRGEGLERASKGVRQVIHAQAREHSRKPDAARDALVELYGDVRRVELFARGPVDGWDVWGNQADGCVDIDLAPRRPQLQLIAGGA